MNVVVVGGAGRMGRWFARYFRRRSAAVTIYDRNVAAAAEVAAELRVRAARRLASAVRHADVVIISVPIRKTVAVLRAVSRDMKQGSVLAEISSVKQPQFAALRELARPHFQLLSIHPLFGPSTTKMQGQRIAVIPLQNPAAELKTVHDLFPEARAIPITPPLHDAAMAYIVLLPYLLNVAFAGTVLQGRPRVLMELASPRFMRQLALTREALEEDPTLYVEIAHAIPTGLDAVGHLAELLRQMPGSKALLTAFLRHIQGRFVRSALVEHC